MFPSGPYIHGLGPNPWLYDMVEHLRGGAKLGEAGHGGGTLDGVCEPPSVSLCISVFLSLSVSHL